jgi:hypothetical protein
MLAKISVSLFLESEDSSVEDISSRIGLQPNTVWRIGDPRGSTGKLHKTNAWKLTETITVLDELDLIVSAIEAALGAILEKIAGHEKEFQDLASTSTAGLLLAISSQFVPPLIVKSTFLSAIGALGVDLEIDVVTQ